MWPSFVHTLVNAEETKHAFTITYRTDAGDLEKITLSRRGEPEGYKLVSICIGGRGSDELNELDLGLAVDGAPGVGLFGIVGKGGEVIKPGVFVTNWLRVEAPRDDTQKLSRQLSDFMHTAEDKLEGLTRYRTPTLKSITYGEDYLTLQADNYRTLTLGLSDRHRFRLYLDGRSYEKDEAGCYPFWFAFKDENGEEFPVTFLVLADEAEQVEAELRAFLRTCRDAARPKFEAAVTSCTYPYAA